MRYARKHQFTACVDDEVEYQADEIEKLVGFVPTKDECYHSLNTCKLMDSLLKFDEEDYQTSRVAERLDEISRDFPEIAFDKLLLVYMSIEYLDGARFLVTFQFDIYGTYSVPKGENLSFFDVDRLVRKIVFERCKCKLQIKI